MITIRFPNGQAIQYNTANFVNRHTDYSDLLDKKDGNWIAHVPNTCIIEVKSPCRVYDGMNLTRDKTLEIEIKKITKELRLIKKRLNDHASPK